MQTLQAFIHALLQRVDLLNRASHGRPPQLIASMKKLNLITFEPHLRDAQRIWLVNETNLLARYVLDLLDIGNTFDECLHQTNFCIEHDHAVVNDRAQHPVYLLVPREYHQPRMRIPDIGNGNVHTIRNMLVALLLLAMQLQKSTGGRLQ
jgi:hypothetical protein